MIDENHKHSIYCNCARYLTANELNNVIKNLEELKNGKLTLEPYINILPICL